MNKKPNVRATVIRPGSGWRHIAGFVRLPNGEFLSASTWPESQNAARMILINGGNTRRGLMAWAMTYNSELRSASRDSGEASP